MRESVLITNERPLCFKRNYMFAHGILFWIRLRSARIKVFFGDGNIMVNVFAQDGKNQMAALLLLTQTTTELQIKNGIPFWIKMNHCAGSVFAIFVSCIVNPLQQILNGILFSFAQSVGRVQCIPVGFFNFVKNTLKVVLRGFRR